MQQLSGQDASFLYFDTPRSPMHTGAIAIYDQTKLEGGVQRFTGILKFIEARLHMARTFRQKLVNVPLNLDHPYWIEDKDFDLEFHCRHIRLPEPGDWRQLCIQAARLHSRPLDLSRPLWEFTVIEGLDAIEGLPKNCYAVVSKVHHACVDGMSGVDLMEATHGMEANPGPAPQPQAPWSGEEEPHPIELLARAGINNAIQPFRFAEVMARSVPAIGRLTRGVAQRQFKPTSPVPRTRFNGTITAHRVVEGRTFSLDDARKIKKAVAGATVNDTLLSVIGGALRRYLESKNELPETSMIAGAHHFRAHDRREKHHGQSGCGHDRRRSAPTSPTRSSDWRRCTSLPRRPRR